MDYKSLKAFHAICMTGSISKAADHLCLTQPAVSIALKKLEKKHGVSLFMRHGPKIELTEEGRALQLLVSDMFDAESSVINFLQQGENLEAGSLKVASDGPVLPLKLLALYRNKYPGIVLNVRLGNNLECWHALMRREVDIALIAQSGIPEQARDHVIIQPIRKQGVSAILPQGHSLARHKSLSLKKLLSGPLLFREQGSNTQKLLSSALEKIELEALSSSIGVKVEPSAVLSSREAIINAVGMGLGIGFCLDDEAAGYNRIVSIPIDELRDTSEDVLVVLPASTRRKVVQAALDFVQDL